MTTPRLLHTCSSRAGVISEDACRNALACSSPFVALHTTDDADRVFTDAEIGLIYIASNHASHAEYAIKAIQAGEHVHIEKPHVVAQNQLLRLCTARPKSHGGVVGLGFD